MTTPDENTRENEGYNKGNREALRQLMESVGLEAIRRYVTIRRYLHDPTPEDIQILIDQAIEWQMLNSEVVQQVDLMLIMREQCVHLWISTDRHICADCGEIGPGS